MAASGPLAGARAVGAGNAARRIECVEYRFRSGPGTCPRVPHEWHGRQRVSLGAGVGAAHRQYVRLGPAVHRHPVQRRGNAVGRGGRGAGRRGDRRQLPVDPHLMGYRKTIRHRFLGGAGDAGDRGRCRGCALRGHDPAAQRSGRPDQQRQLRRRGRGAQHRRLRPPGQDPRAVDQHGGRGDIGHSRHAARRGRSSHRVGRPAVAARARAEGAGVAERRTVGGPGRRGVAGSGKPARVPPPWIEVDEPESDGHRRTAELFLPRASQWTAAASTQRPPTR